MENLWFWIEVSELTIEKEGMAWAENLYKEVREQEIFNLGRGGIWVAFL